MQKKNLNSGFITASLLGILSSSLSYSFVKAAPKTVVCKPSLFGSATSVSHWNTATTEFVVPKSIPIITLIQCFLL